MSRIILLLILSEVTDAAKDSEKLQNPKLYIYVNDMVL